MSDNIIVKLIGQSDMTAVNADLLSLQDREKDIRLEMAKQTAEYQKQLANIGATVKGREAQVAAADKLSAAQKKVQDSLLAEQKAAKATMEDFAAKMKNVNDTVAKGAVQAPKFVTQLRAMKQELAKMEQDGISPADKGFIDLAIRAGELEDQIGDTRNRIKVLASDTKYLDAAMGLGNGLAGGFTVATSAAALLGGENEELQKAFFKVQAVMQIMSGVQAVAIALNKDEAFSVILNNAAEKSSIVTKIKSVAVTGTQAIATRLNEAAENGSKLAKVGSTIAQWALNSAMLASPIFWLIGGVGLLVGAYLLFSDSAKESEKRQRDFNLELQSMKSITDQISGDTDFYKRIAEAQGKSKQEVLSISRQGAKSELDIADKKFADLQKKYSEASKSEKEKMKDGLKQAEDIQKNAWKNLNKINEDGGVLDAETKVESIKASDQARINAMKDGYNKEKSSIELSFKDKLKAYRGQSKEEIQARNDIEAEKSKAIYDLDKKYRNKAINDSAELNATNAKNEELINRSSYEAKKKSLDADAKAQIAAIRTVTAITEREKDLQAAKIKAIELKLVNDLKVIDEQKVNDAAENLVLQDKNAEMAIRLQSKNNLDLQDELNKQTLEDQAKADKLKVTQSTATEQQKADKIKSINLKLATDIQAINDAAKNREIDDTKITTDRVIAEEKHKNEMILSDDKSTLTERMQASAALKKTTLDHINAEKTANEAKYKAGTISEKEYQKAIWDIKNEEWDNELNALKEKTDKEKAIQQAMFEMGSLLINGLYDAQKESLNQESSDLDNHYVIAAVGAKKRADQEFITEKDLAAKKLVIKRKQAIIDKEQSLFNIAIATAENIVKASNPLMAYMIPFIIASGLIQAALVASKPLPKYAKGRKNGKGEFAMVGEKGPETMWIPDGASIVPNGRRLNGQTLSEFGIPELPNIDSRWIEQGINSGKMSIDYNKLGKAVADNVKIPNQKHVTVHVDKNGIIVRDSGNTTNYLNKKYKGSW